MIFDKGCIEVTHASVPTLSAGLLQRYSIAGTADIVIKRLQSVQNIAASLVSGTIFRDHYHYFTQPPLTSGVAQNCFQEHNPVSTYMNSTYFILVKNFRGLPWLRASTGYPMRMPKGIRERRFAFDGPIVWNSLLCVHDSSLSLSLTEQVRTAAEYLSFWMFLRFRSSIKM